jgi:hypothetical protein
MVAEIRLAKPARIMETPENAASEATIWPKESASWYWKVYEATSAEESRSNMRDLPVIYPSVHLATKCKRFRSV